MVRAASNDACLILLDGSGRKADTYRESWKLLARAETVRMCGTGDGGIVGKGL